MRLILATIILTMLAQPVWAEFGAEYQKGEFKPTMTRDKCKKVMAEGVYLGHSGKGDPDLARTSTMFFYKDDIYVVNIVQGLMFTGWKCEVFVPNQ